MLNFNLALFRVTHLMAILQYQARQFDLLPDDPDLLTDLDMIREECLDLWAKHFELVAFKDHRAKVILSELANCPK